MILASGSSEQGKLIIVGLSQGNIDRLCADHPIRITQESHPGNPFGDTTILIFWGPTEQDIANVLIPHTNADTQAVRVTDDHPF